MREIKTARPPQNLAVKLKTQPILAFNHEGKIDLFLFDNTEEEVVRLGLNKAQQIPLPMLACANILYSIARKLRLEPGISRGEDEEIIQTLRAQISENISEPEVVIAEIIDCWNTIATHALSQKYAVFKESDTRTRCEYHGAYKAMIHDYIAKYLATLTRYEAIQTWLFLQANEIIRSTLKRRAFSLNPYIKMEHLIETTQECKQDIPDSAVVIDAIKARLEREQGEWYTTINGLIGFEIEILLEEESLKPKSAALKRAFQKILSGEYENVTSDPDIARFLETTLNCLQKPTEEKFYEKLLDKETNQGPTALQIRQVIESLIVKKLKQYDFKLDKKQHFGTLAVLAGSSIEEEEKLLSNLLNPRNHFTPALLTSIQRRTKNEIIQDIVTAKLEESRKKSIGVQSL